MAGNRDAILADFQACTDIEDVAEAILHLERTNWDLLAAINNVMPQNTQQLPSELNRDVEMIEEIKHVPRNASEVPCVPQTRSTCLPDKIDAFPGTSSSRMMGRTLLGPGSSRQNKEPSRMLTFRIHYLSKTFQLEIADTSTVEDLKLMIFSHSNVSPCQQKLHGWRKEPGSDSTTLKSIELPRENELYMSPADVGDNASQPMKLSDRLTNTYTLIIKDEINNIPYRLNFPGTHTISEVKSSIYAINDVPVRNQLWKGWPPTVTSDSITLAESGISFPEHNLTVERLPPKEKKKEVVDLVDTDSSVDDQEDGDDFEDAPETFQVDDSIDDIFIQERVQPTKIQHLIPDNIEDEVVGTMHFLEEYKKRYGPVHPNFFTGTFEEAVAESCSKPPRERKLLAVYLHHDNSILANVFCTQLLGFETVLQLLSANFIVWGWDCTYESNKQKFFHSITHTLGIAAGMPIRNIEIDSMPVLMVIMRSRSNTDVITMIQGNVGVNDLITNLIEAVDVFQEQRQSDIEFDDERQARERVKEEQDQAYQESLAADRAKEEAKQLLEKIEQQRKEQAENERLAEQARKESHRLAVESNLPPEPSQDGEGVLKIKVRLPSGNFLERRFRANAELQTILNFLIVKGYPTEDYKVISSWPRRDLTTMDTKLTLAELKFCPQETLILEAR